MNGQVPGGFPVDLLAEGQAFLMPVLLGNGRDQFAFQIVQCRKQREGAVTDVVISCAVLMWPMPNGNPGWVRSTA